MRLQLALFALIPALLCAQNEAMNQGIAAFRSNNYQRAVELFQRAVDQDPSAVNPHLYLATAYMSQWIPGAQSPENVANARMAETEFKRVLQLDSNNTTALASLAILSYNQATSLPGEAKLAKFDEARDWYQRLAAVDPMNKTAYYSMGVIVWAKWYPAVMDARISQRMKPEDPGPILNPALREELKAKYSSMIDEGVANLQRALYIDPQYDDAMAYLNLLIRERADLDDTKEQWQAHVAIADNWVQKALATKKMKAEQSPGMYAAPPLPPPPPPSQADARTNTPTRIRVSGNVQAANLMTKVNAVYPPLAQQAQITGIVRFTAIISRDGTILNLQLVSGHPLLVASAQDAVKQYVYKPTILNNQPVEVVTQIDVSFP